MELEFDVLDSFQSFLLDKETLVIDPLLDELHLVDFVGDCEFAFV